VASVKPQSARDQDWLPRTPKKQSAAPLAPEVELTPGLVPWPEPIGRVGRYGIAGEFVDLVDPHTEADPNIVLLTFLVYAGNLLGRNFYLPAGADKHCGNIFLAIVGHTGFGRKGSAISAVEAFFRDGPGAPGLPLVLYGISSGEGIIHEIRDPVVKVAFDKKTKKFEETTTDHGVEEKRLIISLSEMQQFFVALRRQDSIVSSVMRQGWDKDRIQSPSKNSGVKATGACVSLVGGASREELLGLVNTNDAANGTLNRILFGCSRRSKKLPEGGQFPELVESRPWRELQTRFQRNIKSNGHPLELKRDREAADRWGKNQTPERGMYEELTQARAGLWGDVTARGAQQVMRLSVITAVINGSRALRDEHQDAGREQWRYCDASAQHVFGDRLDNPTASEILTHLRKAGPGGMTRSQIQGVWSRNKPVEEINTALRILANLSIAHYRLESTGGRPTERWFAL
jgi:hypothetical protein